MFITENDEGGNGMNVREYLENIRTLDLSIEAKIRQEEMLRTRLTDTAAHIGGDVPISSSPDKDKIGNVIAEIVDLQAERNAEIDRFVDMESAIKEAVKALTNEERIVIEGMYFSHIKASELMSQLYCSRRTVYRIRDKAIANLEKDKKVCHLCQLA